MAEILGFTTPQAVGPTASNVKVVGIEIKSRVDWMLRIILQDDHGRLSDYYYRDTEAQNLIVALNKVNLSTKSLERRCIEQLVTDGKLAAGTITGTPD